MAEGTACHILRSKAWAVRLVRFCALGCLLITATIAINEWWVRVQIDAARRAVIQGEQLWPQDLRRIILHAEALALRKDELAERLARDSNESLRAEGMLMLLRHNDARRREIICRQLTDAHVNQLLYSNGDLARICLRVVDLQGKKDTSAEERAYVKRWTCSEPP
jgi:hypothetical protein